MKSLKDLLNTPSYHMRYKKSLKNRDTFDFLSLIQGWSKIIGPYFASHTVPLKNCNFTLCILSNHPSLAQELKLNEEILKEKIFKQFPELKKTIKKFTFIINNEYFERQKILQKTSKPPKKIIRQRHPHSLEFKKLQSSAELLFEKITDQEIKKKLISLYMQKH